jgi:aldehyde:ferredoxin oxidoreductase
VDVFNPASEKMKNTDKFINPASQEIYADFYNGMLGTDLTWEEIFAQTDRDINLQRVMNVMVYGEGTGKQDRIPERAIGPIDDALYKAEGEYHDRELCHILEKSPGELKDLPTAKKRELLMNHRKEQLRELIQAYYRERGWTPSGIPTPVTLKQIGLWGFLTEEARVKVEELAG